MCILRLRVSQKQTKLDNHPRKSILLTQKKINEPFFPIWSSRRPYNLLVRTDPEANGNSPMERMLGPTLGLPTLVKGGDLRPLRKLKKNASMSKKMQIAAEINAAKFFSKLHFSKSHLFLRRGAIDAFCEMWVGHENILNEFMLHPYRKSLIKYGMISVHSLMFFQQNFIS